MTELLGQMSSFEFLFLGWLFASQKMREMLCISRPEFALQTRAFQGYVYALRATFIPSLRNWLRQPLQSLSRFVNHKIEVCPFFMSLFLQTKRSLILQFSVQLGTDQIEFWLVLKTGTPINVQFARALSFGCFITFF